MIMQIFFGFTFFEVATGSMKDAIQIGDGVLVEITKDVKENDIIVYKEEENFITHRLVEINENGELITKGDANNAKDQPIKIDKVLGKVVYILPKIGILKKTILSKQVLILILTLIILLGVALKITTNLEEKDE